MSAPRAAKAITLAVEREARDLGAHRIKWVAGRRHMFATLSFPDGFEFTDTIARSGNDAREVRVWVRQAYRRARAKAEGG